MADEAVQNAIQDRINRTNYSITAACPSSPPTLPQEEDSKRLTPNHWHKAAVALPASIARFIQLHPNLVPILIDSFCDNAPEYLKERESGTSSSTTRSTSSKKPFGKSYPYEQIVIQPITVTKSNYAELITGRGIVPSFPTPKSYRSVELNRFHRQLCQQQCSSEQFGDIHDTGKKVRKNPFERSVEVGIRLCAGLDWILANNGMKMTDNAIQEQDQYSSLEEDLAINTLGEVERRLRIHWTRIDVEASGIRIEDEIEESTESLPSSWIEQAWQAGPNGNSGSAQSQRQALESMSKCQVFNPELSQPLYKEPCPYTRPDISLLQMVQSGIKNGLKWQRDKYAEGIHFPIPRAWEIDTDDWMNVNSLEELEEEMKNLSSSRSTKVDSSDTKKKPRRTTRRSRRNMTPSNQAEADEKVGEHVGETGDINDKSKRNDAAHPLNKAQIEKLPITAESKKSSREEQGDQTSSVEKLMSQKVNINPSKFLDILHARLKRQRNNPDEIAMGDEREEGSPNAIDEQADISKFFFDEDLDNDCDSSDGSEDLMGMDDNPQALDEEDDPFSLHNIMEAMDHELRTDAASHPTIKNLSVASEEDGSGGGTDADMAMLANLLKSIDEGDGSGPLNTMLNEMGILHPSQQTTEEEDD